MKKGYLVSNQNGNNPLVNTKRQLLKIRKESLKQLFSDVYRYLRILGRWFYWGASFFAALFFIFVAVFTYNSFASDLPNKERIMNRNNTGLTLLDQSGKPFFTFYSPKNRTIISSGDISKTIKQAVVASEDYNFYKHGGFSIQSTIRALYSDILKQDANYGGSTISQQLVKNALLTPKKSLLRKYQEALLANRIEQIYSKEEILEMYLNSVYFGEGAFGIEQAAQTYFGKNAKDLDLAQSAMLVGILPAPSQLSPLSHSEQGAKVRQKVVLQKMLDQKYIDQNQFKQALEEPLTYNTNKNDLNQKAPHFALMVLSELKKKYSEEEIARSGFQIITTLNSEWQEKAEKELVQQVEALKWNRVSNGSVVVLDPKTGEIKALVGSRDWGAEGYGKVNVSLFPRQPGSSFKPIVYAAAFEKGIITPATMLTDSPTTFGDPKQPGYKPYKPQDYDRKYRGIVTARRALSNSLNIPSVEVISKVGIENTVEMAHRLGITTLNDPSHYGLSMVLGTNDVKLLDLTSVYATFANYGLRNEPTTIKKILDKNNQTIYIYEPQPKRVLSDGVAFLISSILSDNNTRSEVFGTVLNISRTAAVKTGTSEDYRDSLTLGYTPSLAIGVWVGNNDGTPMDNVAGSLGAAPLWKSLMESFLGKTPVEQFRQPDGVIQGVLCRFDYQGATPSAQEYFVSGTQLRYYCDSKSKAITPITKLDPTPKTTDPVTPMPSPTPFVATSPAPSPQNTTSPAQNSQTSTSTPKPTSIPTLTLSPTLTSTPTPSPTPTSEPPLTPDPTLLPTSTKTPSPTNKTSRQIKVKKMYAA